MATVYSSWLRDGMKKAGTWTDQNEQDYDNHYSNTAPSAVMQGLQGVAQTVQQPIKPIDPMAQLEALKQAQLKQTLAGLDKSRSASLSNLQAEKATIEPQYQKQKIAANVTAKQTARSFDEYMAQRGGGAGKSGIAGQGTLMNNIAYQGQKGALDQGEVTAFADNARRVTGVQNAYESDKAAANAGVEAQYLQNYISEMQRQQQLAEQRKQFEAQLALQQAGLTGVFNGSPTLAAQNQSFGNNLALAQLMGIYNGQPTLPYQQYQNGLTQQQFENDLAMRQLELQRSTASQPRVTSPTKQELTNEAYSDIQSALSKGTSPEEVKRNIMSHAQEYNNMGISYSSLLSYVDALAKNSTQSPENTMKQLERYMNFARGW